MRGYNTLILTAVSSTEPSLYENSFTEEDIKFILVKILISKVFFFKNPYLNRITWTDPFR